LSRFSEKDQQQINKILDSPIARSLLNRNQPVQTGTTSGANNSTNSGIGQIIEQQLGGRVNESISGQIDEKAGELINRHVTPEAQNALRGIFGTFGNSRQEQTPQPITTQPAVPNNVVPLYQPPQ